MIAMTMAAAIMIISRKLSSELLDSGGDIVIAIGVSVSTNNNNNNSYQVLKKKNLVAYIKLVK